MSFLNGDAGFGRTSPTEDPAPNELAEGAPRPGPARGGFRGLWLLLLVVLAVPGLWWFLANLSQGDDEPGIAPTLAAGARLPADLQAEREAELALQMERLSALQARVYDLETAPPQGPTVPRATAEEVVRRLDRLETQIADPTADPAQIRATFVDLDDLWQERLLALQEFLDTPPGEGPTVALPPFHRQLYSDLAGTRAAEAYRGLHENLRHRVQKLHERNRSEWMADLQGRAQRLRRLIPLRYRAMRQLASEGGLLILDQPGRWGQDAVLEISSYPDRKRGLLLLQLEALRQQSTGTVSFAFHWLEELGFLLVAVALGILPSRLASRADRLRTSTLSRVAGWLATWLAGVVAEQVLGWTVFEILRPLAGLVALYALYRVWLVWVDVGLGPALERILDERWPGRPQQHRRPFRVLGLLFLAQAVVLRLLLGIAGPGALLLTAERFLGILVPLAFCVGAWYYRRSLGLLLEVMVPPPAGGNLARWSTLGSFTWLVAPLGAAIVLLLALVQELLSLVARYDWGKRLSASLFRHWMEVVSTSDAALLKPPPPGYRQAFEALEVDPIPYWTEADPRFLASLHAPLDEWAAGDPGEPVLTLHGPPGAGRSLAAEYVAKSFGDRYPVVELRPRGRLTKAADLLRLLGEALASPGGARTDSVESLERLMEGRPPTVVILPEVERFFLATVGGFEAFRTLQVLVRRCRARLFWVLVLGTPTIEYLRAVSSGDVFPSHVVRVPRWSEDLLRRMILLRHEATGVSYRFGEGVVQAARATPGATPESHYFRILWERSAGNPEVAQEMWLASTRLDPDGGIRVGLPPRNPLGLLADLPGVGAYLLAAVVRHGGLSMREAVEVTSLPERQIYLACERCLEIGVLRIGREGRTTVHLGWLLDVLRFLEGRNLLDGR